MDMTNNTIILQTKFGIGVATSAEDAKAMEEFVAQMSVKLGYMSIPEYNAWKRSLEAKQLESQRLAITM